MTFVNLKSVGLALLSGVILEECRKMHSECIFISTIIEEHIL